VRDKFKKDEDLENPSPETSPTGRQVYPGESPMHLRNGQDADERGAQEVPDWQMPDLVTKRAQRPGARIHKGTSLVLPEAGDDLIAGIVAHLPVLQQIRPSWHLGYSMAVDGVSLRTLYRQVMEVGPCLLIIEDSTTCIFGAFLSEGLRPQNRCHGTHESFLFRFPREVGAWRAEIFRWTHQPKTEGLPAYSEMMQQQAEEGRGEAEADAHKYKGAKANYFEALQKQNACSNSPAAMYCDYNGIVLGIDGPAIFIDQDLLRGVSCPSKAFGSPCMASAGPDFVVRNLEVWHWIG